MALLACACSSRRAFAEEAEVHELSLLTVADRRDNAAASDDPLRTLESADDAGDRTGLPTLARQLAGLPGLIMQEGFGGFDPPRLSVRGSGLQSAPVSRGMWWELDGLPLNAVDGSFNAALIDPALLQAVTARPTTHRAATAPQAMGGAIHLGLPADGQRTRASMTLGPDAYHRASVAAGHDNERRDVWFGISNAGWDGWRPHSAQHRFSAAGRLAWRPEGAGPEFRLRFLAAQPMIDVPGPLTLGAARAAPRSISATAASDRPRRESDFVHAAADLTWLHADIGATRLTMGAQTTHDWFRQLRANGITDTRGEDLSAQFETRRTIAWHEVSGGFSVRRGDREQQRWINLSGQAGTRFADVDLAATQATAWFADSWHVVSALVVDAGFALHHATRESEGSPFTARGRFTDTLGAGHLGLTWAPGHHLRLHAQVARGAEAPTFDDLASVRGPPQALTLAWNPLRTQRADTLEIGATGTAGRIQATCMVYQATWDGELLRLADADGASRGTVNAGTTHHAGIETALRWRLRESASGSLDVNLAHTWSRATMDPLGGGGHRHLAGLPPHAGQAQLTWAGENGIFAAIGATWTAGTTWADHANQLGYGGSLVAHARLGWTDTSGWSAYVDVDNVFDRSMIASTSGVIDIARSPATTALFLPGLPRQVRVGLSWRH